MTNAALAAACVALFAGSARGTDPAPTSEITSNEVWAVDGNGDTLWMLTAKGVNYTHNALAASSGQTVWQGFYSNRIRNDGAYTIVYGADRALLPLGHDQNATGNDMLLFSGAGSAATIRLPFAASQFEDSAAGMLPHFLVVGAAYGAGYFWLACTDGGVVRFGADTTIFYPGRPGAYTFATFTKDSFPNIPKAVDSQTVDVEFDAASRTLWAAQRKALWRLRTDSLSWTRISADAADTGQIIDIAVSDSHTVFASVVTGAATPRPDTMFFKYKTSDGVVWSRSLFYAKRPLAVTFVDSEHLYLVRDNDIKLWIDVDTAAPAEARFADGASFGARQLAHDVVSPEIIDLFYTEKLDTGILWVATTEGLFLSFGTPFRPDSLPNLLLVRRDKTVAEGLSNRNVYAFPSILNDSYRAQRAVFAYNLKEDGYVTIDVFDWNMDHVLRVTDDRFRYAGKNRPDGRARSTVANEDSWDGTFDNNDGTRVAPGVYYFRISSRKDGSAFGKIVVAKPAR